MRRARAASKPRSIVRREPRGCTPAVRKLELELRIVLVRHLELELHDALSELQHPDRSPKARRRRGDNRQRLRAYLARQLRRQCMLQQVTDTRLIAAEGGAIELVEIPEQDARHRRVAHDSFNARRPVRARRGRAAARAYSSSRWWARCGISSYRSATVKRRSSHSTTRTR